MCRVRNAYKKIPYICMYVWVNKNSSSYGFWCLTVCVCMVRVSPDLWQVDDVKLLLLLHKGNCLPCTLWCCKFGPKCEHILALEQRTFFAVEDLNKNKAIPPQWQCEVPAPANNIWMCVCVCVCGTCTIYTGCCFTLGVLVISQKCLCLSDIRACPCHWRHV